MKTLGFGQNGCGGEAPANLTLQTLDSRALKVRGGRLKMELMESIGWIVIGFVPTLLSLEVGYRFGKRSKRPLPDIPKLKELRSI